MLALLLNLSYLLVMPLILVSWLMAFSSILTISLIVSSCSFSDISKYLAISVAISAPYIRVSSLVPTPLSDATSRMPLSLSVFSNCFCWLPNGINLPNASWLARFLSPVILNALLNISQRLVLLVISFLSCSIASAVSFVSCSNLAFSASMRISRMRLPRSPPLPTFFSR